MDGHDHFGREPDPRVEHDGVVPPLERQEEDDCPGGICHFPRSRTVSGQHRRSLAVVLAVTAAYLVVEVVGAIATGSLALFADVGHMLTDVGSLGLALFAIWFAQRPAPPEKTYGYYRTEILAALANALVLFFVAGFIFYEAWGRFSDPPPIDAGPMLAVAALGLLVNIGCAGLLHKGAGESLNMQGAFLEVLSDALSSLGVVVGSLVMIFTGYYLIDPILSVLVALLILPRTWGLLNRALNVLLEGTPSHISIAEVREAILDIPGIEDVHDLHIWTITAGFEAMSGHIVTRPSFDPASSIDHDAVLNAVRRLLMVRFGIEHLTVQIESGAIAERHIA